MVRPRFNAARRTTMSYTLAEAAAAPSDFAEYLIARLAQQARAARNSPISGGLPAPIPRSAAF
jgi:hypothetical protein